MFLLKVAHVFQLIQNEHSAFSIHNEKQNMKIIKRASWHLFLFLLFSYFSKS